MIFFLIYKRCVTLCYAFCQWKSVFVKAWHLKFLLFYVQVLDESKLQQVDSLHKEFETPEKANKV